MAVPGLKKVVNSVNDENKDKVRSTYDTVKVLYGSKGVYGVKRP
tara:strand:+ start:114 stop:245 length:132 start_codon:yes stop_codon:yes gene_type:complete